MSVRESFDFSQINNNNVNADDKMGNNFKAKIE